MFGTVRSNHAANLLPVDVKSLLLTDVEVSNFDSLAKCIATAKPNAIINCVGVIKQDPSANDPLAAIALNAVLPHRLAILCESIGARFVHVSTDCVFSGSKGCYRESDTPDATDLYGLTKYLGEVDSPCAVTLRTSIIGHELEGSRSLLGWLLAQTGTVRGYTHAVFSGLPTVGLARVMRDFVLPDNSLQGTYHVSSEPIAKHDLLQLIATQYDKRVRK